MDRFRIGVVLDRANLHRLDPDLDCQLEAVDQRQILGQHAVDDGSFDLVVVALQGECG